MPSSDIVKSKIERILLRNFRSYDSVDFSPQSDFSIIVGPNGVGKTNLLEAISLLVPGRGLRGCRLSDMESFANPGSGWSIVADVNSIHGKSRIITEVSNEKDFSNGATDAPFSNLIKCS